MKYTVAIVAAVLAGVSSAQEQCFPQAAAIPACGTSCLTQAGSSYGCDYTSFACQCSHSAQINNEALTSCVLAACSSNTQSALAVSSAAEALCSCVASEGGSGGSVASTTAAIPGTTAAITGGSTPTATSAAKVQSTTKASASFSMFTGGAAYAAGSLGGVAAAVMGLLAAL